MEDEALHQLQHEQSKLLDKIDELRVIGIGGLVELPQLIVCGNQSSGKSSVLEAISRVRFPAKSNICTRFATEVVLRRNPSSKIKISIEPGPSRKDEEERRNLRSFTYDKFSNGNDLPDLLKEAKERMGITESFDSGFSDDVLKVEIWGPEKPELTLVDLPGLYYSTSEDQGPQGIKIVDELTEKYMKNSKSIILAVINANADYHIQVVLDKAKRFDPSRERTLGIVTHPDGLEANSDQEQTYLQFIKNEKIHLQLGWHALRNRSFGTQETSDDKRDEVEKTFFNQGRWTSLPRECVGIDSLRRRLSSILLNHIRRNLPSLIVDIQEKVSEREKKLSKLGAARSTLQQQKGFLLSISGQFERITGQALNGLYADEFFGGLGERTSAEDFRRLRLLFAS
ncbi:dynamin GTPase [Aspergillus sclerotialis]|uniref:Dynamin GTPase n=1 Tax=Aspergillus sclerotialis TaxID=2070753 RepID=A0A3A2Z9E6_9EURO|nr:dynamin GTPase [Aspergillus sclerotialis]